MEFQSFDNVDEDERKTIISMLAIHKWQKLIIKLEKPKSQRILIFGQKLKFSRIYLRH